MKILVLFDFDGTLTQKDTFLPFIRYCKGNVRWVLGLIWLSIPILAYWTGAINNQWLKEIFLRHFFRGTPEEEMKALGKAFYVSGIRPMLREEMILQLQEHLKSGHEVAVVSASLNYWVAPFCEAHGVNCISSLAEVTDGKLSGSLKGRNCWGPEKENRIKAIYDLSLYNLIYAYGDSRGDEEMLRMANYPEWVGRKKK